MPYTPKQLAQAILTASLATVYTVPASTTCIVKQIALYNTSTSAVVATVHLINSGGSATATNRIVPDITVAAKDVHFYDLTQVLATGGFIQVVAGTASVVGVTISGVEIT